MDNEYGEDGFQCLARVLVNTREVSYQAVHTMLTETYQYEECYE